MDRVSRPAHRLILAVGVLISIYVPATAEDVVGRPEAVVAHPAEVKLVGLRDARQLLVTGQYGDGPERDLSHLSEFSLEGPGVVEVGPRGYLTAKADGQTTLVVTSGGRETRMQVSVTGTSLPTPVSFRREVVAVLNTTGCNSGGCHGTPSGKNGFRLSLCGFDPSADYLQLTRDQSG